MESLKELYKVGYGPSSSHTIGPQRASNVFKERFPNASKIKVMLYGSLAATGKGHRTDYIIEKTFSPIPVEIEWHPEIVPTFHTNGMDFIAYDVNGALLNEIPWRVYSIGGGSFTDKESRETQKVYPATSMNEILAWCKKYNRELWEYAVEYEGPEIMKFISEIWTVMKNAVSVGLKKSGRLPAPIYYPRKAQKVLRHKNFMHPSLLHYPHFYAYALAVSEENADGADGAEIVTAPTCGAAGVIPGSMYAMQKFLKFSDSEIEKALVVGGLFGVVTKLNASVSGAEVGCQGEVGVACSMASAAICFLMGGSLKQIEYAAEIGLEHHLGMTCDPVAGAVQVPCIERNAIAAIRSLDSAMYALCSPSEYRVTYDDIIQIMYETGKDLQASYRETSTGGLAKTWQAGHMRKSVEVSDSSDVPDINSTASNSACSICPASDCSSCK